MNNDIERNGNDFNVVYDDDMTLIEKLKQLDAAGDKATQGEWDVFHKNDTTDVHEKGTNVEIVGWTGFDDTVVRSRGKQGKNAKFIATAANNRDTIKAAIAELEKQARDIEALRGVLEDTSRYLSSRGIVQHRTKYHQNKLLEALEQTGE